MVVFIVIVLIYIAGNSSSSTSSSNRSSAGSRQAQTQTPVAPPLELLAFRWEQESDSYVVARGQVKNVSGESLTSVQAVITYTDRNGNFVTSDDALIDYNPILPGQTSPYRVTTVWNPEMREATIEFKKLLGGVIPSIDGRKGR